MASGHWAEVYVGMPYEAPENDCAGFVVRVMREVFGREIGLPTAREASLRGQSRQILAYRDVVAEPTENPREGDAVLMYGRGRLCHIGVFCRIAGRPMVLHAMRSARQVTLHRIRDLEALGLKLEGFYRWKTP